MANKIETLVASAAIKSSADKLYNFYKYNMSDIVKIFPAAFTGVQLLEGEEGSVGCVKLWSYILGGISLTANLKTEAIDDARKSITFAVLEGDVLLLYKSFKATVSVSEGLAKWTMEFERANLLTPPFPSLLLCTLWWMLTFSSTKTTTSKYAKK